MKVAETSRGRQVEQLQLVECKANSKKEYA